MKTLPEILLWSIFQSDFPGVFPTFVLQFKAYLQRKVPHMVCWLLLALDPAIPICDALHLRSSLYIHLQASQLTWIVSHPHPLTQELLMLSPFLS